MPYKGKIVIASDHAGVGLKASYVEFLESKGIAVEDLGPITTDSVDFPDYAKLVAEKVSTGEVERGVLICGTGIGMTITANRYENVRAALVHNEFTAEMCRLHNDANVFVIGARIVEDLDDAIKFLDIWLSTDFEGGRHERRVSKMERN